MKRIETILRIAVIVFITFDGNQSLIAQNSINTKPKISLTFDDGSINDIGPYKLEVWNQMLLDILKKNNLKAVLFWTGMNKTNDKGNYVLSSWNNAGHKIANHTYSHPNFSSKKISLDDFEAELLKNDSIINKYPEYYKYFRFPYLKEGNTPEKVNGFRAFLKEKGYRNGHVSIDASDWYIDSRLVKRLQENPNADISGFKKYYIEHLYNRALYYDSLSHQMTKRSVSHVLLLHHNLAAALFLDDVIQYFKSKGWDIMDADKAFQDEIYKQETTAVPAGESIIWALAKQSGKYENVLRYPAEDGDYEKDAMDKLGL